MPAAGSASDGWRDLFKAISASATRIEIDGALGGELLGHVAVNAGDGGPIDEQAETGPTESLEGVAAGLAGWGGAKRGHGGAARHELHQRREEGAAARLRRRPVRRDGHHHQQRHQRNADFLGGGAAACYRRRRHLSACRATGLAPPADYIAASPGGIRRGMRWPSSSSRWSITSS